MGYRSDVVIAIRKETFLKHSLLTNHVPLMLIEEQRHEFEDAYYWALHSVKWYPSYEDVGSVNDFLHSLIDHDSQSAAMSILGEDTGDIEELGNTYDFGIHIESYIHTPF
jgi:hypothetical protein